MFIMDDHLIAAIGKVKSDVGGVQKIIRKPLLDDMLLITGTNHKFIESIIGIGLHNMPLNRHAADLNHGFGFINRFLRDTGSEASRKDYYLHMLPSNHFAPSRFKITTAVFTTVSASIHSEQFFT